MGHLNDALYFVAPAYAVTFVMFAVIAAVTIARLRVWARRASEEERSEAGASPRSQPTD